MQAAEEQAISIAWHNEAFARTKNLKPLSEYLKPPPTFEEKRQAGAVRLVAMLDRLERKSRPASSGSAGSVGPKRK